MRMRMRSTSSTDPLLGSRVHIAVKAGVCAALAWQLGVLLPDPVGDYAYYAPLGAVLAIHPSVSGSLREALQVFVAVLLGAGIGAAFDLVTIPGWSGVGPLVLVAVLVAGWDRLGDGRAWVISAALFTFVIGNVDTSGFVTGLVVQVSLGGLVGLTATLLLPPVPARVARRHLDEVADAVRAQLGTLAAMLRSDDLSEQDVDQAWLESVHEIRPASLRLRASFAALDDSLRGNLRAGRWREAVAHRQTEADVLERVADLVEHLAYTLSEVQRSPRRWLRVGSRPALAVADVLDALSEVVGRLVSDEPLDAADTARLAAGVEDVSQRVAQSLEEGEGEGAYAGASLVVILRRVLGALPVEEGAGAPSVIAPLPRNRTRRSSPRTRRS